MAPLRVLIPDFAALLAMPTDATTTPIEGAPTIGRPLGSSEWIAMLERRLGRPFSAPQTRPKAATGARHRTASAAAVKHEVNCRRNPPRMGDQRPAIIKCAMRELIPMLTLISSIITAVSTSVIAWFTVVLSRTGRRQARLTEIIEAPIPVITSIKLAEYAADDK